MTSQTNNHTAVTALEPCPFCGKDERLAVVRVMHGLEWWGVECNCNASGPQGDTEAGAIEAWNTRHNTRPLPDQEAVIDRLIKAARMCEAGAKLGGKDYAFAQQQLAQARADALAAMPAPVSGDVVEAAQAVRGAALQALRDCEVDEGHFAAVAAATYAVIKAIGEKPGQ